MQSKSEKLNPSINFRRGSKRSAAAKANISKGVKESWKKRGVKLAAGAGALGVTAVALKKKGVSVGSVKSAVKNKAVNLANKADEAIAKKVEDGLYKAIKNPNTSRTKGTEVFEALLGSKTAKAVVDGSARGAKERVATVAKDKAKDVASNVGARARVTADIPKNTAKAFQEGLKSEIPKDAPLNKAVRGLARIRARAEARARTDMKKMGFQEESSNPRNVANLIEFARQKAKAPRRTRKRTAAEKQAISEGLKEYYAGQPKSRNAIDDSNKLSMAALRLSRTGKNVLQMAGQGLDLYQRVQAMNRKQSGWEKANNAIWGGANLLSSVSGSYGRIGSGTRSLVSSADIVDSLKSGIKAEKLGLAKEKFTYESVKKHNLAANRAVSYRKIADTSHRSNSLGGTKYEDMRTRQAKFINEKGDSALEALKLVAPKRKVVIQLKKDKKKKK